MRWFQFHHDGTLPGFLHLHQDYIHHENHRMHQRNIVFHQSYGYTDE